MSVYGRFGYNQVIPASGSFAFIFNLRITSGLLPNVARVLNINYNSSRYLAIETDGRNVTVRHYNSVGNTVSYTSSNNLNYVMFDGDSVGTRVWNPDTGALVGTLPTSRFAASHALSLCGEPTTLVGGASTVFINPNIFYWMRLDTVLNSDLVRVLAAGLHPLDCPQIHGNITAFREYPQGNSNDYITSIGVLTFNGTPQVGTSGYGTKQYGSYLGINNQDRGTRVTFGHSLNVRHRTTTLLNSEIKLKSEIKFLQQATYPIERTLDWTDTLSLTEVWSLVDKYIVCGNEIGFTQAIETNFDRSVAIFTNILFAQVLTNFDGRISNSITFSTAATTNIKPVTINHDVILDDTDIQHNIKLAYWTDTVFVDEAMEPQDYEEYEIDEEADTFRIVEEIICTKELTRPLGHSLTFRSEFEAYKVSLVDQVDFQ